MIADGVFQRGAAGLGQLTSAAGAGAICAMLMLTRLRDAPSRLPALTLVMAFAAFALTAALGVSPNWWLSIALVGALGFVSSTVGVGSQTMIQITVDESYRGRVMSLWSVVGIGGAAVGAVVLGAFADLVGIGWAFFSVSAVCAATLAYLSSRSLKSWA